MSKRHHLLMFAVTMTLVCTGCQRISLQGGGAGKGAPAGGNQAPNPILGVFAGGQNAPAKIDGEWHLSFDYNGQSYDSTVNFAQNGNVLSGDGKDDSTGSPFMVTEGTVNGTKVHFVKKYMSTDSSQPPVDYTGELTYSDDPDYRGWMMGGHYKTPVNGQLYDDKWIATSAVVEQASAQAKEQAAQQPAPQPAPTPTPTPEPTGAPSSGTESGGTTATGEPNISGMYNASYTYNFKKIMTKLWLEQDGSHVGGHGVDTNTNEKFTVAKGWYTYPKVTLVCKYVKGKSAAENRELIVKANVTPKLTFNGETQFGGHWEAKIVR